MATYILMTAGAFGILIAMNRDGKMVESVSDLSGLSRIRPGLAYAMTAFMFSFAGVPPFAGFFGKLFVFLPAIHAGFYTLAIIGVLTSVITAYYYLRIIKIMFFDEPAAPLDAQGSGSLSAVILVTAVATTLFFVTPSLVIDQAAAAAQSLFAAVP
jgi:NADH-quinone oxidoreductase subunit N